MNSTVLETFRKYGPLMAAQDYPVGNAILVVKGDDGIYSTKAGIDFENITEDDISKNIFAFIPNGADNSAMVLSQTPSCVKLMERGKDFKPSLDDMAQIIGPVCKFYESTPHKLGMNAGCFVKEILGGSYTLTIGRSLYEAIVAMTVLEKSATVSLLAEKIGGEKPISSFESRLMRFVYMKKYSKAETKVKAEEQGGMAESALETEADAPLPEWDPKELKLREELVEHGKLLVESGLVQGTWGNLSARLDEKFMLVTPSGLDYERLTPADMVKVNIETMEYEGDLKPTSEKGLHGEIYKRRKDIKAIIHTHSQYASVYAAAEKDFSEEVKLAKYGLPGTKGLKNHTADALGDNFGAIMSHHGMIVCDTTLKKTFAACKKLESQCATALK